MRRESSGGFYQYVQIRNWGEGVKNTELDSVMPSVKTKGSGHLEIDIPEIPFKNGNTFF